MDAPKRRVVSVLEAIEMLKALFHYDWSSVREYEQSKWVCMALVKYADEHGADLSMDLAEEALFHLSNHVGEEGWIQDFTLVQDDESEPDSAWDPGKKKPALWSQAYLKSAHADNWRTAKANVNTGGNAKARRPISNDHAEQKHYRTMVWLPRDEPVWIGFYQNEYPCKEATGGCCAFFAQVSLLPGVAGVVFNVTESGDYANQHGFRRGASGVVYFVNGQMTYTQPPDAPPPPP